MQLDGLEIIQNQSGYKFSTDSVLLANFAKAKQNDVYVDLCSGSGVVAILFSWKNKLKKAYAVELQPQLADMAKRSILHNKLDGVIEVLNQDLSTTHQTLGYESVDVITVNPPYNEFGETSEIDEIAVATHELKTNLSEIVVNAEANPEVVEEYIPSEIEKTITLSPTFKTIIIALISVPIILLISIILYKFMKKIKENTNKRVFQNNLQAEEYYENEYIDNEEQGLSIESNKHTSLKNKINKMRSMSYVKHNKLDSTKTIYPKFPSYNSDDDLL